MKPALNCPICHSSSLKVTVARDHLPAMQNYVHRSIKLAKQAKVGQFELSVCSDCGFAFNSHFDETLLDYDQGYDNSVPSRIMARYYESIAKNLYHKHNLSGGLVVDVGCGKGTFLKTLTTLFPDVRGLGIDPSYEGELGEAGDLLTFKREFFSSEHLQERPTLVVCRHVLEHIPSPVMFLETVKQGLTAYSNVPVFFEVPDAQWILESEAFWDFCYEHCNYFTSVSLHACLSQAGFMPSQQGNDFGGQYLWIEAIQQNAIVASEATTNKKKTDKTQSDKIKSEVANEFAIYAASEAKLWNRVTNSLNEYRKQGKSIALWGMATKGVVFAYLIDPKRTLISACVDVNTNKQGCFVPISGHIIESPQRLTLQAQNEWVIVVMNPNYFSEIALACESMGVQALFIDASGKRWNESVIPELVKEVVDPIRRDQNASVLD